MTVTCFDKVKDVKCLTTVRTSTKMYHTGLIEFDILSSNGIIAKFVVHDHDLLFQGHVYQMLRTSAKLCDSFICFDM